MLCSTPCNASDYHREFKSVFGGHRLPKGDACGRRNRGERVRDWGAGYVHKVHRAQDVEEGQKHATPQSDKVGSELKRRKQKSRGATNTHTHTPIGAVHDPAVSVWAPQAKRHVCDEVTVAKAGAVLALGVFNVAHEPPRIVGLGRRLIVDHVVGVNWEDAVAGVRGQSSQWECEGKSRGAPLICVAIKSIRIGTLRPRAQIGTQILTVCTHAHAHIHTCTHTHPHTHDKNKHAHTRGHTDTRTHTHTRTCRPIASFFALTIPSSEHTPIDYFSREMAAILTCSAAGLHCLVHALKVQRATLPRVIFAAVHLAIARYRLGFVDLGVWASNGARASGLVGSLERSFNLKMPRKSRNGA